MGKPKLEQIRDSSCCYCNTRAVAFVLGWLQTIGGALIFSCALAGIFIFSNDIYEEEVERDAIHNRVLYEVLEIARSMGFALFTVVTVAVFAQIVLGILLIVGVHTKSVRKLKMWCLCQIPFLIGLGVGLAFVGDDMVEGVFGEVFGLGVGVSCIGIVAKYRLELLEEENDGLLPPSKHGPVNYKYYLL